ncbi:MAG: replication initiator protein [Arizlama microvirus]|nr:MAG: replication initiator protein [Arizlama microvirus]
MEKVVLPDVVTRFADTVFPVAGSGCDDVQCRKPRLIKGVPGSAQGMFVPCGNCMSCRVARTREWTTRLYHEMGYWPKKSFVTLTYDDEHLPGDGAISKRDLQLWLKRIRKDTGKELKYYACGEYGDRLDRPHYHCILFGIGVDSTDIVRETWGQGFVKVGTVTRDSIQYVAGYIRKKLTGERAQEYGGRQPPFQLASKSLGLRFAEENAEQIKTDLGVHVKGQPVGLPRYYRRKLDISAEDLMARSEKSESETRAFYIDQGMDSEADIVTAIYRAKVQADDNTIARMSLKDNKL